MSLMNFPSFTIIFSFIIFVLVLFKLVTKSKIKYSNLPPGPRKLPFIGNLHLFATSRPPHRTLHDLSKKHGPIIHLRLGEINTLVVSSPEYAKQVMKTHDINFANRPSLLSTGIITYGNKDIAFAPYGEYWRQLRKIFTLEILSAKRVQSFRPIREEEFSNLCRWIASNEGSTINLTEKICLSSHAIITRATLGKKTKEQELLISVIKDIVELVSGFQICDVYPSIKLFHRIGGMKGKIEKVHRTADVLLDNIINEHKLAQIDHAHERHDDLIDVLLKFQDDGLDVSLTIENIKAVLLDLFIAGIETSATTIDWAMSEMLRNPSVLEKAQREVRLIFHENGYVDEARFDELKYLKLVIKETLRLHPPIPLLVPRENSEACEIDGFQIPVKSRVIVNAWAIGRDSKYWKDAENFKPERYLEHEVDFKGNSFEYIPFGAGRRICPGMTFGLANVELPLAMFLYHFDWILPNGMEPEELDMNEKFGLTAARKNDLYVIPVVRKPLTASLI